MKDFSSYSKEKYYKTSLKEGIFNRNNDDDDDDDFFGDSGKFPHGGHYNSYSERDKEKYLKDRIYKIKKDQEYVIGDIVIYLGNTKNMNNQEGVVERLREDGKVIVRFKDMKLIAISRDRLVIKPSEDLIKKALNQFDKDKKKWEEAETKRRAEEEKRRIEMERLRRVAEEAERKRREEEEKRRLAEEKKRLEELKNRKPGDKPSEKWWERNKKTGFE